jgi:plastocyanin domain-containing protein
LSSAEWIVLLVGVGMIAWINWYFLAPARVIRVSGQSAGPQEVRVVVQGGYDPAAFVVSGARPVRLIFDRQETSGCSEEVVFPELGVRRFLAPFERTVIDLGQPAAGTYEFTCGMSMLRGRMVVE